MAAKSPPTGASAFAEDAEELPEAVAADAELLVTA